MHVFISYDFQDIVCQKLQRLVQAALSFRRKLCGYFLRYTIGKMHFNIASLQER